MSQSIEVQRSASRLPDALYTFAILLTCIWVMSLPVFPSRDSPLHLYYINAFRQVLVHKPGVYTETYWIRTYLPPYATYYYGLIALGHFVSLETADKLFVCFYVVLFAISTRTLLHAVAGSSPWVPFLLLPVLLNWPLMMGFVNYALATCLACFALAAWFVGHRRPEIRYRVLFLFTVVAMVLTHPLPWMFVVTFVCFDLFLRWVRSWRSSGTFGILQGPAFRLDLLLALLSASAYVYLARFRSVTQNLGPYTLNPVTGRKTYLPPPPFSSHFREQALGLLRTHGLDVFGGHGIQVLYRAGIDLVLVGALSAALWCAWRGRGFRPWQPADTWLLFSLLLVPCLIIIPDHFGGGYFFVSRLQLMLYISCIVAGSAALGQQARLTIPLALLAFSLSLFTLYLGARYITPVAHNIASLQTAPVIAAGDCPGLVMQPVNAQVPRELNYDPYFWAAVHYVRRNNLLLFNTAWLGDPVIPIRPRPEKAGELDTNFFNLSPQFHVQLLSDEREAGAVLRKVSFVVMMREETPVTQSPFAEDPGATTPGAFADGWHCVYGQANQWTLCTPPAFARASPFAVPQ